MTTETRPLRLAYVRVQQAAIAVWLEKLEDASLGGDEKWLDGILASLKEAQHRMEALAVAEGIELVHDEDLQI